MAYGFKNLATVDAVTEAAESANVLIEENGKIKKVPKKQIGGGNVDELTSDTLKTADKSIIGAINELYDLLGGANATIDDIKSIM